MKQATWLKLLSAFLSAAMILSLAAGCGGREVTSTVVSYEDDEEGDVAEEQTDDADNENQDGEEDEQDGQTASGGKTSSKKKTSKTSSKKSGTTSETTVSIAAGDSFGGRTITISGWGTGDAPTAQERERAQLIETLQKKYNCKIAFKNIEDSMQYYGQFVTATTAGTKFADIVRVPGDQGFPNAAVNGLARKLDGIVNLKSTAWHQKYTNQALVINGSHYYVSTYNSVSMSSGIFFNKDLFNTFGQKTPYDYDKANNWNFDTFEELCKNMTATRGGRKYYGCASIPFFFEAAGIQRVTKVNGKETFNLDNQKAYDVINFGAKLWNNKYIPEQDGEQLFLTGYVAMMPASYYQGARYKESLGNKMGFCYMPKYDKTKDYQYFGDATGLLLIPTTYKDKDNPALLGKLMEEYYGVYSWRDSLETRLGKQVSDKEGLSYMMGIYNRAARSDFWSVYYPWTFGNVFWTDYGVKAGKSPQQFIASVKAEAQKEIDAMWAKAAKLK